MSLYSCRNGNNGNNNDDDDDNSDVSDDLVRQLRNNLGRVITVFTSSGGCSGRGFTGLLTEVNDDFIKLITSLPCAPRHPFGLGQGNFFDDRPCCRDRLGTAIVIPINKIVSIAFNQI